MLRRIRASAGGVVYHVLNRGVRRMRLFCKADDFVAMEQELEEAVQRTGSRLLAYCPMATYADFCRGIGSPEELIIDFGLNTHLF